MHIVRPREENYNLINFFRVTANFIMFLTALKIELLLPILITGSCFVFALAWFLLEKTGVILTSRAPGSGLIPATVDVIVITVAIIFTGNVHSILVAGYYFSISVSSMNMRVRQGEYAAILSIVLYAASCALVLAGILPGINILGWGTDINAFSFSVSVGLNGFGFLIVHRVVHEQMMQTGTLVNRLEKSEQQLIRQNEIVRLLLRDFEDQSSDWLCELDSQLRITYISAKFLKIKDAELFSDRPVFDLFAELLPPDDSEADSHLQGLRVHLEERKPFSDHELKIMYAGSLHWIRISAVPLIDGQNTFTGWHGVLRDITEKKLIEIELYRKAYTDEGSGLANRYQFRNTLDSILSDPEDRTGILGIMKLGKIDEIRTNLGTRACDSVIRAFIGKIYETFGTGIILARLELNEFGFWIDSPDVETLESIHRFSHDMNEPLLIESDLLNIDLSMGIAFYPDDASERSSLFRAADLALNNAQAPAARKVVRYREDLATYFLDRLNLVQEFPLALKNGEFFMLYQPQVDAARRTCVGVEALIRWNHPGRGIISPGTFIPLAEQTGFIIPLGEWMLRTVCAEAALWKDPLPVSVNVSGVELSDARRLRHSIMNALEESGLPPDRLTIEITESAVTGYREDMSLLFDELQHLGIQLALDDFGTGYSSLSYMQNMHLNKLKIDQSFIRNIGVSEKSERLINVMLEMSKSMGLSTVAEGIENETQAAFLQAHGCDWLQGYLFGKPMNFREIKRSYPETEATFH